MIAGRFLIATILGCCIAQGAQAAVLYNCQIDNAPAHSFMSAWLNIVFDPAAKKAEAADWLIQTKTKSWMPVKIETDDPARTTFQWQVKNIEGTSNGLPERLPGVRETVTVLKGSFKVFVSQYPIGADNSFSARGTCSEMPYTGRF